MDLERPKPGQLPRLSGKELFGLLSKQVTGYHDGLGVIRGKLIAINFSTYLGGIFDPRFINSMILDDDLIWVDLATIAKQEVANDSV